MGFGAHRDQLKFLQARKVALQELTDGVFQEDEKRMDDKLVNITSTQRKRSTSPMLSGLSTPGSTATTTTNTTVISTSTSQIIRRKHTNSVFIRQSAKITRPANIVAVENINDGLNRVHNSAVSKINPVRVMETFSTKGNGKNRGHKNKIRVTQGRPSALYVAADISQRMAFVAEDTQLRNDNYIHSDAHHHVSIDLSSK